MTRPVYVLNSRTNGSDLIGEAVAAYASMSILFEKINPQLSVALEDDAFTMYELMNSMTDTKYSDAKPNAYKVRFPFPLLAIIADWSCSLQTEKKRSEHRTFLLNRLQTAACVRMPWYRTGPKYWAFML